MSPFCLLAVSFCISFQSLSPSFCCLLSSFFVFVFLLPPPSPGLFIYLFIHTLSSLQLLFLLFVCVYIQLHLFYLLILLLLLLEVVPLEINKETICCLFYILLICEETPHLCLLLLSLHIFFSYLTISVSLFTSLTANRGLQLSLLLLGGPSRGPPSRGPP